MAIQLLVFATFSVCICNSAASNLSSNQDNDAISNQHDYTMLSCAQRYISEAYFSEHDNLIDSNFQDFVVNKLQSKPFARQLVLERHLIGEGSHRRLCSAVQFNIQSELMPTFSSQLCEIIVIERLPSGVFVDPFELEHLVHRGVFKDASAFGDLNLELPAFRSNWSIVEVHIDAIMNKSARYDTTQEVMIEIPLHARYSPLENSGYTKVRFGSPNIFLRCKRHNDIPSCNCLLSPIATNASQKHVVWSVPSGIQAHATSVSILTFVSALLSAFSIIIASLRHSHMDSDDKMKQS